MKSPLPEIKNVLEEKNLVESQSVKYLQLHYPSDTRELIIEDSNTIPTKFEITGTHPTVYNVINPLQNTIESFTVPNYVEEYTIKFYRNYFTTNFFATLPKTLSNTFETVLQNTFSKPSITTFRIFQNNNKIEVRMNVNNIINSYTISRNSTIFSMLFSLFTQTLQPISPQILTTNIQLFHITSTKSSHIELEIETRTLYPKCSQTDIDFRTYFKQFNP
jgi:hypothetical protein